MAAHTVSRVWELRRRAEKCHWWFRPVMGLMTTSAFAVLANPDLLPGGLTTGLVAYGVVFVVALVAAVVGARRASVRGHTGLVTAPERPGRQGRPWWRNPVLAVPAVFFLISLGRPTGAFDHWAAILGCAITVGIAVAVALPRYETADHIHGARLDHPPRLTADVAAADAMVTVAGGPPAGIAPALADGAPATDVLELLVLQHHTGERRISWCADVLGTDTADIRDRIARGRRWLELPATEVHRPATADWVRLTAEGRRALSYV